MTDERKKVTGHILACGTQIMWGATFVSTKVLLNYFLPAEVLFTRAVLAFLALLVFYPHHLKLKNIKQELTFAGAGLFISQEKVAWQRQFKKLAHGKLVFRVPAFCRKH